MLDSVEVERTWHTLPGSTTKLEVLRLAASPPAPSTPTELEGQTADAALEAALQAQAPRHPPLLFVHGSFHGAWCWEEQFLPYFAAEGYDCYALSLRGQGGSELGDDHPPGAAGTLQSHVDDLASFIATLPAPPVLVVHSFSGLLAYRYVSQMRQQGEGAGALPPLAGLVLLGAAPPTGPMGTAKRAIWRAPLQLLRVIWTMITKSFRSSPSACRFLFFSPDLPQEDLEKYLAKIGGGCGLPLANPAARARDPGDELAPPPPGPGGWAQLPPGRVFVGCGALDVLVDRVAVEETAAYFGGARMELWEGVAHDVMLDSGWEKAAAALGQWLAALQPL